MMDGVWRSKHVALSSGTLLVVALVLSTVSGPGGAGGSPAGERSTFAPWQAQVGTNDFRISDMGPDGTSNYEAEYPAVVYNPTNNEFLVVWSGDDDTAPLVMGEQEIFGQRIDAATGAEVGTNDFRISDMGTDGDFNITAFDPAVAYNSTNNEYLVVWWGDDQSNNEYEIYGQRINAATGAEVGTNDFRISDMGDDGQYDFAAYMPSVAYNSTNNEYLVVWHGDDNTGSLANNEFEIYGQRINAATGSEIGTDMRLSSMGTDGDGEFDPQAADVAYNSADNEYLVVWMGEDDTAPLVDEEWEIFGQRIDASNGNQIGVNDYRISHMGPNGDTRFDGAWPAVTYNSTDNEYFVVWMGDDDESPLVAYEFEIFGQRINAETGAEVGATDFRISDMGPDGATSLRGDRPDVVYSAVDNEYLVVWHGDDLTPPLINGEHEIFGQFLEAASGREIDINDIRLSDIGPDGNYNYDAEHPAVAFGSAHNTYLVAWQGDDATPPLVNDEVEIHGQLVAPSAIRYFIANQPFLRFPRLPVATGPRGLARSGASPAVRPLAAAPR